MAAERVDGELAAAVDEAVLGDVLADLPEAQPDRALTSATDISGLYVRHRNGLAAHARRFLRDSRDVDEVVQETFLRLFLAIGEIETELQAIAFARRTLTNLCIDRYRADRRRPMLVNLEAAPLGDLAEDWNADDPVLRAEDAAIVREALARLSPLHRAALVKREIEEKPLPQIAAELDIPEESVKHLLFRARRALRRLLVGTSVEPGADLTAAEVAAIANRRAGAALLRGANVFIVLVVGAVVAAVGVRALEGRTQPPTVPAEALGGGGLPATGTTGSAASPHRPGSGGGGSHHAVEHHVVPLHLLPASPPVATRPQPTVAPVTHPPASASHQPVKATTPTKPTKPTNGTFSASRSHFRLSGPLEVRGTPQVATTAPVTASGGQTTASSSFSAPTSEGTFQLAQTLSTSAVGAATVSVTPSFVVGNAVETPTMTGSTASVQTAPDGAVTVDAVAAAEPDPTTNAFPLTSLTVHLVLSPGLRQVVSEQVILKASAEGAGSFAAGTTCTLSAGSPQRPDGALTTGHCPSPSSGAPAGPAGEGDGSDTSPGQMSGSEASTMPGVLEISGMSGDDRQAVRSFTTSGGASS